MKFQKGDIVEVWDVEDGKFLTEAQYFAFNDHPEAEWPHMARLYNKDGTTSSGTYSYRYCRYPTRPDLKEDDPVWVFVCGIWRPRHFHEWTEDGKMRYYGEGYTSHTSVCGSVIADRWSLKRPQEEL